MKQWQKYVIYSVSDTGKKEKVDETVARSPKEALRNVRFRHGQADISLVGTGWTAEPAAAPKIAAALAPNSRTRVKLPAAACCTKLRTPDPQQIFNF